MTNNLGGDMPQSRLDSIKAAWMNRWGTTEQDWETFQQQNPFTTNVVELKNRQPDHEFDSFDEVSQKMEFPFCPDWREMGWRYRTKSFHFQNLAAKATRDNPVQAQSYRTEARFWDKLSRSFFKIADDNRRKL